MEKLVKRCGFTIGFGLILIIVLSILGRLDGQSINWLIGGIFFLILGNLCQFTSKSKAGKDVKKL